jgi:hypothetical protein
MEKPAANVGDRVGKPHQLAFPGSILSDNDIKTARPVDLGVRKDCEILDLKTLQHIEIPCLKEVCTTKGK